VDGADWYTTLVAYFNSLRELGGALVLMQDDVDRTLEQLIKYRGEDRRDFLEVTELTSRVSSSEVREILDQLEVQYQKDGFIDVLLASNMISVGVDISRLGLMVVNGQPKTMSEYIQSTSRVGRGKVPGVVVTLFNDAKARDRSRFETFRTWHSTIYRDVEATSVTPFSSRARDKALHAALIGMVRHLYAAMKDNPVLASSHRAHVEAFAALIKKRADSVDPEEAGAVEDELTDLINNWENRTGLRLYWNDRQINTSLLISAEEAAKRRAMGRAPGLALPTPNSMRNVEPSTVFILRESLTDGS
jgi:superfamily II DNA/RNA helicase